MKNLSKKVLFYNWGKYSLIFILDNKERLEFLFLPNLLISESDDKYLLDITVKIKFVDKSMVLIDIISIFSYNF